MKESKKYIYIYLKESNKKYLKESKKDKKIFEGKQEKKTKQKCKKAKLFEGK